MNWADGEWAGTVTLTEDPDSDTIDSDSDLIPLALLMTVPINLTEDPDSETIDSDSDSDLIPLALLRTVPINTEPTNSGPPNLPARCEHFHCFEEVWAACHRCLCFLCYNHFTLSDQCSCHNLAFAEANINVNHFNGLTELADVPIQEACCVAEVLSSSDNSLINTDTSSGSSQSKEVQSCQQQDDMMSSTVDLQDIPENADLPRESARLEPLPEDFLVEGEPAPEDQASKVPKEIKSKNVIVKRKRNTGEAYISEKTRKMMPARREASYDTRCTRCDSRKFSCACYDRAERAKIRSSFFDLNNLLKQREWIARQLNVTMTGSKRKIVYNLPSSTDPLKKTQVCKQMFLSTLGISSRQTKTVVNKMLSCGLLEGELRGGRQTTERDTLLRESVRKHIDKFPRMESHYCRASSRCEYLSSDLNAEKMHCMYQQENEDGPSLSLYKTVLREMKLKFHSPKKDQCGICDTYHRGTQSQKEHLATDFAKHINEKNKVREIKRTAKERACSDPTFHAAVFDLQQVIYLPKSTRSELFYKRRLANYNFTVFSLGTKEGTCYLSHEGQTKRGSCEIASHIHSYLCGLDDDGIEEVEFFADGCPGQNKNSILPSMMLAFIEGAKSIKSIRQYFFEAGHGQSEGDSMHSVVERAIQQVGEIMLPAQLACICRMARSRPRSYTVITVKTADIMDWKTYSQRRGVLRVRSSEGSQVIDWTKFRALQVTKRGQDAIGFKYSHLEDGFDFISLTSRRRGTDDEDVDVEPLYRMGNPKLSQGKYTDLMTLCTGDTAVISHPEYQAFYRMLPH